MNIFCVLMITNYQISNILNDHQIPNRHGHNSQDDPSITQPLIYDSIKNHPATLEIYQVTRRKENTFLLIVLFNFFTFKML